MSLRAASSDVEVRADLHLHVGEAGLRRPRATSNSTFSSSYPSQPADVVYAGYPELDLRLALGRAARVRRRGSERLVGREHVRRCNGSRSLPTSSSGVQVHEQLTDGLPLPLRPEIPDGVYDRGGREVDDALLRARASEAGRRTRGCARTPACRR